MTDGPKLALTTLASTPKLLKVCSKTPMFFRFFHIHHFDPLLELYLTNQLVVVDNHDLPLLQKFQIREHQLHLPPLLPALVAVCCCNWWYRHRLILLLKRINLNRRWCGRFFHHWLVGFNWCFVKRSAAACSIRSRSCNFCWAAASILLGVLQP